MGHPTHAFDLDLLEGGKIVVRRARSGETLKTLDGVDRKLSPEDLVIADAVKPVALAGVMGGFDTMITEKTRNVLIESAWFDPVTVRRTAKRHGMHTDASHRFERGADFGATTLACARVAHRILEAGGELEGGEIDVIGGQLEQAPVELRLSEVYRILGTSISADKVARILERLGFTVIPEPSEEFTVHIPSWRLDIEREIDVIEEIARLHGYNNFSNTLPSFAGAVVEPPDSSKRQKVRSSLLALGYNEAVSLTFISREEAKQFSSAVPTIELANPVSEEASVMRTALVPGMLNMLTYNLNRGADRVRIFEAGNTFEASANGAIERGRACLAATGTVLPEHVQERPKGASFFDLKGDIEILLSAFDHEALYYDAQTPDYYHPGRSARAVMDGATVAQFGQLHPDVAAQRKFRQDVFIAEVDLDRLYQHDLRHIRYEPLPRYPAVERDFSLVFDDRVSWERIANTVDALEIRELRSLVPAEIFRGGTVLAGKYSLLVRATFQSHDRTLREDEVSQWSARIVQALQTLGGGLRSS
jgi:phenylalanyl-tRNA synthetase beta chain